MLEIRPAPSSELGHAVQWDHLELRPGQLSARVDRMELAIHEAGHAVLAALFGLGVPDSQMVTIKETETGASGRTPMPPLFLQVGGYAEPHVLVCLAGHAAVEVLMPELRRVLRDEAVMQRLGNVRAAVASFVPGEMLNTEDDDEDLALAIIAFTRPHASDTYILEMYRRAETQARSLIGREAVGRAIEAVMTELVIRSCVSGRMVRAIVTRCLSSQRQSA